MLLRYLAVEAPTDLADVNGPASPWTSDQDRRDGRDRANGGAKLHFSKIRLVDETRLLTSRRVHVGGLSAMVNALFEDRRGKPGGS